MTAPNSSGRSSESRGRASAAHAAREQGLPGLSIRVRGLAWKPAGAIPDAVAPLQVRVRLFRLVRLGVDARAVSPGRLVHGVAAPVGVVDRLVAGADGEDEARPAA